MRAWTRRARETLAAARFAVIVTLVASLPVGLQSSEPPDPAELPVFQYVGVKGCARCHTSKATGNQIQPWKDSAHARAYKTLLTDQAREVARSRGIDTPPEKTPLCLTCHTTAPGEMRSRLTDDFDIQEGVSCEACHGPGSEYSKIQHMIKHEKALEMGMQIPNAVTCRKCHNADSPTFKGFDYGAAMKAIAHPLAPL